MNKQFEVQGIPVGQIAEQFGTPFFLYDGKFLVENFQNLRRNLFPGLEIFYSLKANPNISIYALLNRAGAKAEVSSLTELATVAKVGTPARDIIYLGPGKDEATLHQLVAFAPYAIVCESFDELDQVNAISREKGKVTDVALRINPSTAGKGSRLTMGGKPRQFGIDESQVFSDPQRFRALANVRVIGTHTYLGTRILDANEIAENTKNILELADRFQSFFQIPLEMVDIGGGLGVPYFDDEKPLNVELLATLVNPLLEDFQRRFPQTRLIMELGRYLAAESGTFVSRVLYVKESFGEKFAVTDGGTNCHMAAVGVGSFLKRNFPVANLSRLDAPTSGKYHVTGPLCTPGDVVAKGATLPEIRKGDLMGVLRSGAYGPTASPVLFLSFGYPAEVLVHEGRAQLIRKRDAVEDMLRQQILFS